MPSKKEIFLLLICFVVLIGCYMLGTNYVYSDSPKYRSNDHSVSMDYIKPIKPSNDPYMNQTPLFDSYAQSLGYADGNDYIMNGRVKNKMGINEPGGLTREQWERQHAPIPLKQPLEHVDSSLAQLEDFSPIVAVNEPEEVYTHETDVMSIPILHSYPVDRTESIYIPYTETTYVTVPEPSPVFLLGIGLIVLSFIRNKKPAQED